MRKIGKINILGRQVPVLATSHMPDGAENFWAYYDIMNRIIVINDTLDLPKHIKVEILYHEICHATMDRLGFNATSMDDDTHEMICEAFRNLIADHFELKDKALIRKLLKDKTR